MQPNTTSERGASGLSVFFSKISDIGKELWERGAQVHISAGSAAKAWACSSDFPTLAVFSDQRQASEFYSDSQTLNKNTERNTYFLNEIPLSVDGLSNRSLQLQRGETLTQWSLNGGILVSTPGAILAPFLSGNGEILFKAGEEHGREQLITWLEHEGFSRRSDIVWSPGQYVFRGLVLDVFDPVYAFPIRVEFFDETIESIRSFNPQTQRSAANLDYIELHSVKGAKKISLISQIPKDARIVLFEPKSVETQANSYLMLWNELEKEARADKLPAWEEAFLPLARFPRIRATKEINFSEGRFGLDDCPLFRGDSQQLCDFCVRSHNDGYELTIVSKNEYLLNMDVGVPILRVESELSGGFVDRTAKKIFISDRELAGVTRGSVNTGWRMPNEWRNGLASGQIVVHEDYGVGIFRGVDEIISLGEIMDAVVIEFAQNQRLMLPVLQINKLTPMPQHEGDDITLDSLRGTKWKKSAAKTKEQAEKEAREILDVFAKREMIEGFAFPPHGELYEKFSKAFPYVETADQLDAIRDVMKDMSTPHPMDRLIVGDVGYGKTEIAMRAAVRAVEGGKQVAILVPTTILAQQHGNTFKTRMTGFPIKCEVISRFVSTAKQNKILDEVAAGRVDILIGTQRLLQKDIKFKDIGLLVIDEEHRLGVLHKELLKQKYQNIDVLTLSATPIPRTLSLSLRGLRDISQLSTPPHNRIPVMTFSGAWQASLVKKAIASELLRGGQVYFVANRIARVDKRKAQLENLFPEAKIAVAHGQMPPSELEQIMLDFYDGRYDILICTTIIESGLDIARANTLIVDDSQELGLSQMYQLRGRVGRREESAFAYFFYPDSAPLRKETVERLDAITRLSDIGSGYSLAMQDLEIRGGGEILGTNQHGKGEKGGFNFFYKVLEEEIEKLRGFVRREVKVDSEINGSIPTHYIPQENVRVTLYRRILRISDAQELEELRSEIIDRFGMMPELMKFLFDVTLIRNVGAKFGLEEVTVRRNETIVKGEAEKLRSLLRDARRWELPPSGGAGKANSRGGIEGIRTLAESIRLRSSEI